MKSQGILFQTTSGHPDMKTDILLTVLCGSVGLLSESCDITLQHRNLSQALRIEKVGLYLLL